MLVLVAVGLLASAALCLLTGGAVWTTRSLFVLLGIEGLALGYLLVSIIRADLRTWPGRRR